MITNHHLQDNKLTFISHLVEFKSRIISCIIIWLLGTGVGFFIHKELITLLVAPLESPLYYTTPVGGFNFIFTISIIFGFLISIPFILYQCIQFIGPAFATNTYIRANYIVLFSYILAIIGVLFAYYLSLPFALTVLKSFGDGQISYLISTDSYLSFVVRYLVGFGLLFQLPLILIIVNSIIILKIDLLFKVEKWIILCSFILAAILTPTGDVINQIIMAFPIILLYQVSIGVVFLINRKRC